MTESGDVTGGKRKKAALNAREQRRAAWWKKHNPDKTDQSEAAAGAEDVAMETATSKPVKPTARNAPTVIDIPSKKKQKRKNEDAGADIDTSVSKKKQKLSKEGKASGMDTSEVSAPLTNASGFRLTSKADRKLAKAARRQQQQGTAAVAASVASKCSENAVDDGVDETLARMDVDSLVKEAASTEDVAGGALLAEKKQQKQGKKKKKDAYVLFLGQLPYDVTEADVRKHFEKAGFIEAVRLLTKEGSEVPRGIGYIEFSDKQAHKRALMLHHSKLKGRQINVEFTSRGRKTQRRMEHLKEKNANLAKMKVPLFNTERPLDDVKSEMDIS